MRVVLSLLLFCSFNILLFGQETSAKPMIAPGGLTVIPPNIDYESIANRADITDLLPLLKEADADLQREVPFDPQLWSKDIRYARDVWCLQFSFKPLRIIEVDIPNAAGNFDKKKIWYLVYNVENLGPSKLDEKRINSTLGSEVPAGGEMKLPVSADATSDGSPRSAALEVRGQSGRFVPSPGKEEPISFVPQFVLATQRLVIESKTQYDPNTAKTNVQTEEKAVSYIDRIVPLALPAIMRREGMKDVPETSVTMSKKEVAPGQSFWGVAMWTDIDPRINEFSIYVSGLTNAYQWTDQPAEAGQQARQIGEGRTLKRRVLKTDWWRVGDQNSLNESQIHFGSMEGKMPVSIFDLKGDFNRDGKVDATERERFKIIEQEADTNKDNWVDGPEKVEYHRIHQDWLQPSYGYEWLFL
jgi:hypothetical protein